MSVQKSTSSKPELAPSAPKVRGGGVAYLVIGSTGTGKSSLINLFTNGKQKAEVGHGASACTKVPKAYQHKNEIDILIDTVGIEDTAGMSDESIMSQTLQFLQKYNIKNVAVIWIVNPTPRASQQLQKQAKYIDSLRTNEIWHSTILIVKQTAPLTLPQNSQGARSAASEHIDVDKFELPHITYNCTDWFDESQFAQFTSDFEGCPPRARQRQGYLTSVEVEELVQTTLDNLKWRSCQVIFEDSECMKCGVIGDKRCMPDKCHSSPMQRHSGKLVKIRQHKGKRSEKAKVVLMEKYHDGTVSHFHPGQLITQPRGFIGCGCASSQNVVFECCDGKALSQGCKARYTCCKQMEGSEGCKRKEGETKIVVMDCCGLSPTKECGTAEHVWDCCDKHAMEDGCITVCRNCDKPWNDKKHPGCLSISIQHAQHECKKVI